ncbi:MAG: ATP-binding protein [Caulobacteraceae bacterium]
MPPILRNLAARFTGVLLGSLVVIALVSTVATFTPGPKEAFGPGVLQLPVPAETRAIVDALEASTPQSRPLIVRALTSSIATVHLEPAFPPVSPDLQRSPKLERQFAAYSRELGDRAIRVEIKPHSMVFLLGVGRERDPKPTIRMMVSLRTRDILVIENRPPVLARSYIGRWTALVAGIALVLFAGLHLAVRQTARPVRRLAESARRFSLDQAAPDLPRQGPQEVRELAVAFNAMQARIRGLAAERTRLLAAIAHDLRTYLTRLRLRTEFVADPDQRRRAERDIEEMAQLIDDTLLFAQQTTPKASRPAEHCDANAELWNLISQRREIGEGIDLNDQLQITGAPLPIYCPAASFRRMLNNLLDNAIRYGARARVSLDHGDRTIEVTVEDDGKGVPADRLEELTQPFLRLETSRGRETGGAGLGLAIVKGLAESCNGALVLSNAPGGGFRAKLTFLKVL